MKATCNYYCAKQKAKTKCLLLGQTTSVSFKKIVQRSCTWEFWAQRDIWWKLHANIIAQSRRQKRKNYSTEASRVLPDRTTDWAGRCLTSLIERDVVFSSANGRRYPCAKSYIYILNIALMILLPSCLRPSRCPCSRNILIPFCSSKWQKNFMERARNASSLFVLSELAGWKGHLRDYSATYSTCWNPFK